MMEWRQLWKFIHAIVMAAKTCIQKSQFDEEKFLLKKNIFYLLPATLLYLEYYEVITQTHK